MTVLTDKNFKRNGLLNGCRIKGSYAYDEDCGPTDKTDLSNRTSAFQ